MSTPQGDTEDVRIVGDMMSDYIGKRNGDDIAVIRGADAVLIEVIVENASSSFRGTLALTDYLFRAAVTNQRMEVPHKVVEVVGVVSTSRSLKLSKYQSMGDDLDLLVVVDETVRLIHSPRFADMFGVELNTAAGTESSSRDALRCGWIGHQFTQEQVTTCQPTYDFDVEGTKMINNHLDDQSDGDSIISIEVPPTALLEESDGDSVISVEVAPAALLGMPPLVPDDEELLDEPPPLFEDTLVQRTVSTNATIPARLSLAEDMGTLLNDVMEDCFAEVQPVLMLLETRKIAIVGRSLNAFLHDQPFHFPVPGLPEQPVIIEFFGAGADLGLLHRELTSTRQGWRRVEDSRHTTFYHAEDDFSFLRSGRCSRSAVYQRTHMGRRMRVKIADIEHCRTHLPIAVFFRCCGMRICRVFMPQDGEVLVPAEAELEGLQKHFLHQAPGILVDVDMFLEFQAALDRFETQPLTTGLATGWL
ncbi:hypothetical protein SISSUDRAFT_1036128 [Sistotremastrum suecicum HHB10207 ss-3]|uniref:Uncharacterized protein n=1 Tax=Sistotremastrum suecicum HHB10207 ss-3 TaxID=1314776 RepID=A0A165ZU88_9AGAM|nr:hypothetical protein SISSUDRAFT_1036128 [Sistotremastrum suecicum HHB10207 ss-3]